MDSRLVLFTDEAWPKHHRTSNSLGSVKQQSVQFTRKPETGEAQKENEFRQGETAKQSVLRALGFDFTFRKYNQAISSFCLCIRLSDSYMPSSRAKIYM